MRYLIIVALALSVASAHGQGKKQEAQTYFRSGERAFAAGQYALAAQAFEEAYSRFASPAIAFSAAQSYRLQYFVDKKPRNLKRAVELYRAYLGAVASGGRRGDAVANLAELEPILQRLEASAVIDMSAPATRVTKLLITTDVKGAKAMINGGKPEPMPLAREVTPGKYRVQVEVDGYFPYDETREVFDGQFRVVEVELRPRPAKVVIKSNAGSVVKVNGRTITGKSIDVAAGSHWVTVSKRGRESIAKEISVVRGQTLELEADLKRTTQRTVSWVVLGTSAASLVLGTGYLLSAGASDSDASDLLDIRRERGLTLEELDQYNDLRAQRGDRLRNSYVFFGAGVAIGAAGVLMYMLDTPAAPERPVGPAVVPVATGDSVGAVLSGRF